MASKRRKSKVPKSISIKDAQFMYTVDIVSYPINVFYVPELPDESLAEWHPATYEIYVTKAPSGQAQADRELHELLHAISSVSIPREARLNELQVNTLSLVLADVLAKNPLFVDRLIGLVSGEDF